MFYLCRVPRNHGNVNMPTLTEEDRWHGMEFSIGSQWRRLGIVFVQQELVFVALYLAASDSCRASRAFFMWDFYVTSGLCASAADNNVFARRLWR
jgi:hypothetical protein